MRMAVEICWTRSLDRLVRGVKGEVRAVEIWVIRLLDGEVVVEGLDSAVPVPNASCQGQGLLDRGGGGGGGRVGGWELYHWDFVAVV